MSGHHGRLAGDPSADEMVDAAPLVEHLQAWFKAHPSNTVNMLSELARCNHFVLRELEQGTATEVNIVVADKILMETNGPCLANMYPLTDLEDPIQIR